ncbi:MAG: ATP synthase F0 subunit B [Acidobacteria bacterium]|nr:ATP synthase F0 subunit B [Acidobacteriota bacterium]
MLISGGINLTPDESLIAIMVIFFLEYLVLRVFFFQPLNQVMTAREKDVRDAATRHEDALARFNEATREMEARIGQAKKQGAELREALKAEAARHRTETVDKTRKEADVIVEEASDELATSVAAARQKIDGEAGALARLAVERIVGRAL